MTFCTDTDLLHWEPNLFRDASFASQVLLAGTGDLAGTTFTASGISFTAAHISANGVILLTGGTSGSYPIVSVDSATQLTLSVLYDNLFPLSGSPDPSPVGSATGLAFAVRTFSPQSRVVSDLILQAAGLDPSADNSSVITNPQSLRRPCVLGTLQMIYSALSAAAGAPAELAVREALYERLYSRAIRNVRIELDLNGDGQADTARQLNVVEMMRV